MDDVVVDSSLVLLVGPGAGILVTGEGNGNSVFRPPKVRSDASSGKSSVELKVGAELVGALVGDGVTGAAVAL